MGSPSPIPSIIIFLGGGVDCIAASTEPQHLHVQRRSTVASELRVPNYCLQLVACRHTERNKVVIQGMQYQK